MERAIIRPFSPRCFPLLDRQGRRLAHVMRFNVYNRAPGPKLDAIDQDHVVAPLDFDVPEPWAVKWRRNRSRLIREGCWPTAAARWLT